MNTFKACVDCYRIGNSTIYHITGFELTEEFMSMLEDEADEAEGLDSDLIHQDFSTGMANQLIVDVRDYKHESWEEPLDKNLDYRKYADLPAESNVRGHFLVYEPDENFDDNLKQVKWLIESSILSLAQVWLEDEESQKQIEKKFTCEAILNMK